MINSTLLTLIVYAYMQSAGLVNGHIPPGFRHAQLASSSNEKPDTLK